MKLKTSVFLTAAALGCGATAHAAPGESLDVAITNLLSGGCGLDPTAASSGFLLDPDQFSRETIYSNIQDASLGNIDFFRRESGGEFVWEQEDASVSGEGSFVGIVEANRNQVFGINEIYVTNASDDIIDIQYELTLELPNATNNMTDFTGFDSSDLEGARDEDADAPTLTDLFSDPNANVEIVSAFNPVNLDNSTFSDGNQLFASAQLSNEGAPDIISSDLLISAQISQVVDFTDTYTPNVALGGQLMSVCTTTTTRTNQTISDTYEFEFEFNDVPGIRTDNGGSLALGSNTTASSGTGTGLAAIQAQETVSRRRGGLLSTIKRLFAKAEREEEEERRQALRPYKVASLGGTGSPYIETDTSSTSIFFDASVGMINLERDPSDFEGGYSADTMFANVGTGFSFDGPFAGDDLAMIGITGSYESTESDSDEADGTGMTAFETEATTIGGFVAWSSEVVETGNGSRSFNATLSAAYGDGDQLYERQFRFDNVSNMYDGDLDQSFTSVSFQAGMSQRVGNFTIAPRVAVNHVQFETDSYSEDFASGGEDDPGMAFVLDYAGVDDEWTEFKIGAVTAIDGDLGTNSTWELALAADAVFVDDAETPDRTAFFVQDLRTGSARTPIIYSVSDLDDQYYDLSASVTMSFNDRVQPYARVFTRQGYEFVEANGAALGIRLVY